MRCHVTAHVTSATAVQPFQQYFLRLLDSNQVGEARKDWNKRGVNVKGAFTVTCK